MSDELLLRSVIPFHSFMHDPLDEEVIFGIRMVSPFKLGKRLVETLYRLHLFLSGMFSKEDVKRHFDPPNSRISRAVENQSPSK